MPVRPSKISRHRKPSSIVSPGALWLTVALMLTLSTARAMAQGCPGAESAALAWISKMSQSAHTHSYKGVVTLQRGGDMQVMQVSRKVGDTTSFETLTQLNGQGAHVERVDHPLDCVHPGHRLLEMGSDIVSGRCGITRYYHFSVVDGERVAGRKTVRIHIEPRDIFRYGYLMSLDRNTGLLLKTEILGEGNRTLEKFQFADVSYDAQAPAVSDVDVVHRAKHPDPQRANVSSRVHAPWSVQWLPPGFVATDTASGNAGRRTYTDGLAVVSVFLEDLDNAMPSGEGIVKNGGTTSYSRGLELEGPPALVTVIGDIPLNSARMIADSIRWVQ